jgi:hypothetical protein
MTHECKGDFAMKSETTMVRHWAGDVVHDLWNRGARRATVLIESAEREALGVLIDDSGQPSYYRIQNDEVPAFIAAATQAWSRSSEGSLAVVWGTRFLPVMKGVVGPPPPQPIREGVLHAGCVMVHHQLLGVLELALRRSENKGRKRRGARGRARHR